MGKNAYLIISDLHDYYKNIDNRFDYPGEIAKVKEYILELGAAYRSKGYNPVAILLGDVNHRSYQNVNSAILNNNYWIAANEVFTKIYSVLGNHEITYYSSNPFFTLVSDIDSVKLQTLQNKTWQPIGLFNVINVVDYVNDGEVVFHFNHYGCPVTIPEKGKYNIGLFHTEFVFSEIAKASEDSYNMNAYVSNAVSAQGNELLETYDLCFFAHHHKIYGCWDVTTDTQHHCMVYHLGSLGRPNVTEVNNNFLERNIPVVLVEDGRFVTVEDNKFMLPAREICVREDIVAINRENYERTKELQIAKDYKPIKDNPVENIRDFCSSDAYLTQLFEDLIKYDRDRLSVELEKEVGKEGVNIWH